MLAIFTVLEQKESKQQSLLRKIYLRFLIKKGLIASGFTILLLYNSFPAFFFFRNLFGLSEGVFDQNLLKVVNYLLLIPTTVWLFIVYKTLERLLLRPLWYNICIWIVINIGVPLGFDCYSGGYPFYWAQSISTVYICIAVFLVVYIIAVAVWAANKQAKEDSENPSNKMTREEQIEEDKQNDEEKQRKERESDTIAL